MVVSKQDAETVSLLNEALNLPYRDRENRKRLIFRLEGLLRKAPSDQRVRIVLARLYGDDDNVERASSHFHAVNLSTIAGDETTTASYLNLSIALYEFETARTTMLKLYRMKGELDHLPHQYAGYAAFLGDANALRQMASLSGEAAAISRDILQVLQDGALEEAFEEHQRTVCEVLFGMYCIENYFSLSGDPESPEQKAFGITFVHRFNLPFEVRIKIQRSLRSRLSGMYQSRGVGNFEWLERISHVICGVDDDIER